VRETLFNWLGQDLSGFRCLDLYAGSGVLGFEALSRGASHVTLVDRDAAVSRALEKSAEVLNASGFKIICSDALKFLGQAAGHERYDLIFLDPPFANGVPDEVLAMLPDMLQPGGRIFLESASRRNMQSPWCVEKDGKAGKVFFQLLRQESK
jgi:16S rRNA (guanine(966)-N(2))-methyltransferase RsmD